MESICYAGQADVASLYQINGDYHGPGLLGKGKLQVQSWDKPGRTYQRLSGNRDPREEKKRWIPAFAGMTKKGGDDRLRNSRRAGTGLG